MNFTSILRGGNLIGRLLVALLFILAAYRKVTGYDEVAAHMSAEHVPAEILPLIIAFEAGAGLALIVGWRTQLAALSLAGFCVLTAAIFHSNFADHVEVTMFLKNLAIAGGLTAFATAQPNSRNTLA